jgi:hypothetical protein
LSWCQIFACVLGASRRTSEAIPSAVRPGSSITGSSARKREAGAAMFVHSRQSRARQPQQVLRGFVPTLFKGRRVRVFTPDAVVLGNQPVVEDIEEIRGGLIPFPPLGNVIDIVRRQRDSTP